MSRTCVEIRFISQPFLQPKMRDLPLLLGCFVQFRRFVILQASPQNLQNFRRRFPAGTDDKDALKTLLVFPIAFRQSDLHILARSADPPLLLARPRSGPRWSRRPALRFANSRMAAKRFHPIGLRQTPPHFVAGSQQSCFIARSACEPPFARPCSRTATRQNLLRRFIRWQPIPSRQHITHVFFRPAAPNCSRNSATRFPATAERYRAVDRISSIGRISAAAVVLRQHWTSADRSVFPSRFAPSRPNEAEPAPRFRSQVAYRRPRHPSSRPNAAKHTFEIACAFRAPTLRACA